MNTKAFKMVWKLVILQIFTAFLASGASVPATTPSTSIILDAAAAVNNTSNPSLTIKPSCIVPADRYVDITIRSCQLALDQLMLQPSSSRRVEYEWEGRAIRLTGAPCIISLECAGPCPHLLLSAREIVGYAYRIVSYCGRASMGWMRTDGASTWLVTVTGAAKGNGIVNTTIGETGNTTLVEDQGEGYDGLTESS